MHPAHCRRQSERSVDNMVRTRLLRLRSHVFEAATFRSPRARDQASFARSPCSARRVRNIEKHKTSIRAARVSCFVVPHESTINESEMSQESNPLPGESSVNDRKYTKNKSTEGERETFSKTWPLLHDAAGDYATVRVRSRHPSFDAHGWLLKPHRP